MHRYVIRPVLSAEPINQLLVTGGVLFFLQAAATLAFGIEFRNLGVKMTPELKSPSVVMPFDGFSQAAYAQKMIDEARASAAAVKEKETQRAIGEAEQILAKAREAAHHAGEKNAAQRNRPG